MRASGRGQTNGVVAEVPPFPLMDFHIVTYYYCIITSIIQYSYMTILYYRSFHVAPERSAYVATYGNTWQRVTNYANMWQQHLRTNGVFAEGPQIVYVFSTKSIRGPSAKNPPCVVCSSFAAACVTSIPCFLL